MVSLTLLGISEHEDVTLFTKVYGVILNCSLWSNSKLDNTLKANENKGTPLSFRNEVCRTGEV